MLCYNIKIVKTTADSEINTAAMTFEIPEPIISGTIIYAILGGILMFGVAGAQITGMLNKDNAQ